MLDSIRVALSGLVSYARGLKGIAQNTDNLGTTAYKSALLQFRERVFGGPASAATHDNQLGGQGVDAFIAQRNFSQGDAQTTDNPLDLMVDGNGWFVLRDAAQEVHYSRAGTFAIDDAGRLIDRSDGAFVQGLDSAGQLTGISLEGLRTSSAQPTRALRFGGNLSSTQANVDVDGLTVVDANGTKHSLSLSLQPESPGFWQVTLKEAGNAIGSARLGFIDGRVDPAMNTLSFDYTPTGAPAQTLQLNFGADVTSFAADTLSTLALISQDGRAAGALSSVTIDTNGYLDLRYDNGANLKGARLALARFDAPEQAIGAGGTRFRADPAHPWHLGFANEGAFGSLRAGVLERSNVDLTQSLSELVILQRGYQGSSQVLSTANDLLQTLFDMGGRR